MSVNTAPLFSIIIPVYNAEKTLKDCLESIMEQDNQNFEVLILDNISTDGTLDIIRDYNRRFPNIKLVSAPDKGIYDAMNKGIDLCKGEWIYFLGSDDTLYAKNVLSTMAGIVGSDKIKVFYGNVIMRGKNQWNLDNVVFNGEYDLEKLVNVNICHQAIFYHKSVFELYGKYNLNYKVGADQEFNLRCYAHTAFRYADLIVANFFVGGQSTKVTDHVFHNHRGSILYKYFKTRIYGASFVNSRLFIRRAATSPGSPLNIWGRLFCLGAYIKLKMHSLVVTKTGNSHKV